MGDSYQSLLCVDFAFKTAGAGGSMIRDVQWQTGSTPKVVEFQATTKSRSQW